MSDRMHPVSGLPFDFDTCCSQCIHFTDKVRSVRKEKVRTTRCALDPEHRNLADIGGTAWHAMSGCARHQRNQ